MNLIEKIQQAASRNYSAPAFIHDDREFSYRDFDRLLRVAIKLLHDRNIHPGDVVGLTLGQSPLHIIAMLALARLGAISIPIHTLLSQTQREKLVAKYGIRTIVSHSDHHKVAGTAFIQMDTLSTKDGGDDLVVSDFMPNDETPFRISLSSGTTGEPKGVMFTHGYLLDRIEKLLYECDSTSKVIAFDLNFALGFVFTIGVLSVGGTVIFPRQKKIIEAINRYGVTHAFLSPVKIIRMNAFLPAGDGIAFPTLKHLRIVGDTPSNELLDIVRARFSPNVFVPYGLTELGAISIATPEILATWPSSAGKVRPWTKVDIIDAAGNSLPPGKPGEIRVMLDNMPTEYFLDAEQSKLKFRDGWFYTGDHGRLSEEGLLFIEGRIDDIINMDGHKLSPGHVEKILVKHPDVSEAVAFAITNASGEQSLAAAVVPRTNEIRLDDLTKYAQQQLGIFFPKRFFVMRDFPRNSNGKVLRNKVSDAALKTLQDTLCTD